MSQLSGNDQDVRPRIMTLSSIVAKENRKTPPSSMIKSGGNSMVNKPTASSTTNKGTLSSMMNRATVSSVVVRQKLVAKPRDGSAGRNKTENTTVSSAAVSSMPPTPPVSSMALTSMGNSLEAGTMSSMGEVVDTRLRLYKLARRHQSRPSTPVSSNGLVSSIPQSPGGATSVGGSPLLSITPVAGRTTQPSLTVFGYNQYTADTVW